CEIKHASALGARELLGLYFVLFGIDKRERAAALRTLCVADCAEEALEPFGEAVMLADPLGSACKMDEARARHEERVLFLESETNRAFWNELHALNACCRTGRRELCTLERSKSNIDRRIGQTGFELLPIWKITSISLERGSKLLGSSLCCAIEV